MKIKPSKGYALIQIVAEDFEQRGKILIPRYQDKSSMFYNRTRIIALGEVETTVATGTATEPFSVGDIVIISRHGFEMGVPGQVKNEEGKWIDVMLLPRNCIIGRIEGDFAEDIEAQTLPVNFDKKVSKLIVN